MFRALRPSAASTHSPDRVVFLTAAAACRAVCRACVSPCPMQAAGRALAQGRADARSTPRGQAHLWRDLPSQAWAPVLALAWATQIASTSSTRWPRIRPASRRSRCALFIGRISLRAAVGRCALRQGASRVERLVLRGGCDSLFSMFGSKITEAATRLVRTPPYRPPQLARARARRSELSPHELPPPSVH